MTWKLSREDVEYQLVYSNLLLSRGLFAGGNGLCVVPLLFPELRNVL